MKNNITWGVDGYGRAHLTLDGRNVIFCGLVGYSGLYLKYYYSDLNEILNENNRND